MSRYFFHFCSKLWFFAIIRGVEMVKGQKMAQNIKKLYLSHSFSQEQYIIWLWFLVHKCKWWYLQQIVSFFKILIFEVLRGRGKRVKNDLKLPISVCCAFHMCDFYFFVFMICLCVSQSVCLGICLQSISSF